MWYPAVMQLAVMAITKWSIQAPSSKKSPRLGEAAALRKKSPALRRAGAESITQLTRERFLRPSVASNSMRERIPSALARRGGRVVGTDTRRLSFVHRADPGSS